MAFAFKERSAVGGQGQSTMVGPASTGLKTPMLSAVFFFIVVAIIIGVGKHGFGYGRDYMFVEARPNGCCRLLDDPTDFFTRICIFDGDGGE